MAHGLVVGHEDNKTFVSIVWDPAQSSPTDALYDFIAHYPHATTYSIVETQCDGSIRPVMSGHISDLPQEVQPPFCDSCFGVFERYTPRYGITGGPLGLWIPTQKLHHECAHMWADNVNASIPDIETEVSVFKVTM